MEGEEATWGVFSQNMKAVMIYTAPNSSLNSQQNTVQATYIGGLNPYSAEVDFSRQNLTSVDVGF